MVKRTVKLYRSLRGILAICLVLTGVFVYLILHDSKEKKEHLHTTGRITYLDQRLGILPYRNAGEYRYLMIQGYRNYFEFYPAEQKTSIDSLHVGDTVTAWYYETTSTQTHNMAILMFLDKNGRQVYQHNSPTKPISCAAIFFLFLLCLVSCYWYRTGKLRW